MGSIKRISVMLLVSFLVICTLQPRAYADTANKQQLNSDVTSSAEAPVDGSATTEAAPDLVPPMMTDPLPDETKEITPNPVLGEIKDKATTSEKKFNKLNDAVQAGAVADVPKDKSKYNANTILVSFKANGTQLEKNLKDIEAAINAISAGDKKSKAKKISDFGNGKSIVQINLPADVTVDDALLAAANDENVDFVQPNYNYTFTSSINDSGYGGNPWELKAINAFNAWDKQKVNGAVTIVDIDTGVCLNNVDLADNLWVDYAWDAYREQPLTTTVAQGLLTNDGDTNGHGTSVAGMAVAVANNGIGYAGSSYNAKLLPVFACGDGVSAVPSDVTLLNSCNYILSMKDKLNIRVVNMSFGYRLGNYSFDDPDSIYKQLVIYQVISALTDAGILVVAGAGNDGDSNTFVPSDFPEVVGVTATDSNNNIADFSDHSQYKDIAAPGKDVRTLFSFDPNVVNFVDVSQSGTSLSSPMVAGVAALLFAANSNLTPAEAKDILCKTATDLGDPGFDPYYGWGLVNADAAVKMAQEENNDVTPVIATGAYHCAYVKADGTVWTWGLNIRGQLGDDTVINRFTPVQVQGLSDIVSVAGGYAHTAALRSDGTVWTWGQNNCGQLGDGTTTQRITPVQVSGLSDVVAISTGQYDTIALKSDGTVWGWGTNVHYELGDGTNTDHYTPVQAIGLSDVVSISAGNEHTLAVKSDGTAWGWGDNYYGELGIGSSIIQKSISVPTQITALTDVVSVATGYYHSVALKSDGTVWTFGYNYSGQIGDGTTANRYFPWQVSNLTDVIAIAAGLHNCFALKSDGTVWGWGQNGGLLGDGTTTTNEYFPVKADISNVTSISAGQGQTSVITADGGVWTWGGNFYGGLGNGMNTDSPIPVKVVWDGSGLTQSVTGASLKISGAQSLGNYEGSHYFDPSSGNIPVGVYTMSDGSTVEIK